MKSRMSHDTESRGKVDLVEPMESYQTVLQDSLSKLFFKETLKESFVTQGIDRSTLEYSNFTSRCLSFKSKKKNQNKKDSLTCTGMDNPKLKVT